MRDEQSTDPKFLDNIEDIRHQIDVVDAELLNMLGERMKLADKIGMFKNLIISVFFNLADGMKSSKRPRTKEKIRPWRRVHQQNP